MVEDNEVLESEWGQLSPDTRDFFMVSGAIGCYDSVEDFDGWRGDLRGELVQATFRARASSREKLRKKAEAERAELAGLIETAAGKRKPSTVDELHKQIMKGVKK